MSRDPGKWWEAALFILGICAMMILAEMVLDKWVDPTSKAQRIQRLRMNR
tara:strand:- start:1586 stop:1735 length:150 start_codon:yes stop_codon:yes gene_type:complete